MSLNKCSFGQSSQSTRDKYIKYLQSLGKNIGRQEKVDKYAKRSAEA
jgi:hypothetical protein